ncbi:MAG: helix-hairpin-helix domain-containing protein [Bacteroidetes bacterium]|nr:helix-hairpin-helix domain-containing protein [Bacteroidota bacterium]
MSNFFKEYFSFSQSEKKGILILLAIIIILLAVPKFLYLFQKEDVYYDYSKFSKEIDDFENSLKENNKNLGKELKASLFYFDPNKTTKKQWKQLGLNDKQIKTINNYKSKGGKFYLPKDLKKIYGISPKLYKKLKPYIIINSPKPKKNKHLTKKKQDSLFDFNPNSISKKQWQLLGLSERQSQTIKNYLQKGGEFYKKQDLKKIYGITGSMYIRLEPFIQIQKIQNDTTKKIFFDINTADTTMLKQIKGIGSYFANSIVKNRNFLGGYYKKQQLLEIYGMTKETYSLIEHYFYVDTTKIKTININTADFKTINKHIYITYSETKALIHFRKVMGEFKSINDIVKYKLIPKQSFEKIKPYLVVK